MDVNGTRFHLITGNADWRTCRLEGQPDAVDDWSETLKEGRADDWLHVGWDSTSQTLTLRPLLSLFPRGKRDAPLQPAARRGTAADRFGNWYWISHDQQQIIWKPSGSDRPQVYWTQTLPPRTALPGEFQPQAEAQPVMAELCGLTVTERHYLVVGNITQGGVFLFDLHAGGEPLLLLFPEVPSSPPQRFVPFDLAPAPGGGVWVLDRTHRTYWGLDRSFRIVTSAALQPEVAPEIEVPFHPVGGTGVVRPAPPLSIGFPLEAQHPISIEALPDGSVLILDRPDLAAPDQALPRPSMLYHYRLDRQISPPMTLEDDVEVVTADAGRIRTHLEVVGHDIAYTPHDQTLYIVERDGNQVIAFTWDLQASPLRLGVQRTYLPMHFFGGRALAVWDNHVYYDVAGRDPTRDTVVRWVQVQAIDQPRYQRTAMLLTWNFDGKERNCVWHRLCLDACIPPETSVEVWSRAENDVELLGTLPFTPEPPLYRRGADAEVPYYQPFPESTWRAETTGTWELLLQQARGCFLQIKLVLTGNGRTTPHLRALRVYYPRFSYPQRYLPAVYQDDEGSAQFLERLLANPEGFYTEIEGKIAAVSALFDARSAPADTLDWLAGWLGLVLDPLWARIQERRQANGVATDRRRLFIRYALALYNQRGTPNGLQFALHLLLDPCLETTLQQFKAISVHTGSTHSALQEELARLGLPSPTPTTSEEELETLLHDYLLTPDRLSQVRIVERFLTRAGRAAVAGDPTQVGVTGSTADSIQASAHRFSVLVPETLSPEEAAMVERIINLEKPAHTLFDVRRYWDAFRVGEARLGLDTALGETGRFAPMVLGQAYLAEGYLSPAPPMDTPERFVSDRDRPGQRPL